MSCCARCVAPDREASLLKGPPASDEGVQSNGSGDWLLVVTVAFCVAINWGQRILYNAFSPEMIHQLRLTQTEYSLMAGHSLAFNGMAALSSLVAGPLADQLHRPRFLAFGMLVLSITTAAGAAAQRFWGMMPLRMIGGAAEAIVMPAAVSLISTHLPRSRLHLGVAIVTSGASFGMGLTFLIQAATGPDVPVPTDGISHGRLQVPDWDWGPSGPPGGLANNSVEFQYHPLEGWYEDNFRAGFVALGLLGLLPIPVLLFTKEIPRPHATWATLWDGLVRTYSLTLRAIFRTAVMPILMVAYVLMGVALGPTNWTVGWTTGDRKLPQRDVSITMFVSLFVVTAIGALGGGWLADFTVKRHKLHPLYLVIGFLLFFVFLIEINAALPDGSGAIYVTWIFIPTALSLAFAIAMSHGVGLAPLSIRATLVALFTICTNFLGGAFSAYFFGLWADHLISIQYHEPVSLCWYVFTGIAGTAVVPFYIASRYTRDDGRLFAPGDASENPAEAFPRV